MIIINYVVIMHNSEQTAGVKIIVSSIINK